MFSAQEILKMTEPGEMFSDNVKVVKEEYAKLAKTWHPDHNDNSRESNDVMVKINSLYNECLELIKTGVYKKPGLIRVQGKDGKTYQITYRISRSFELGTMYIGNSVILYLLDGMYEDLVQNAEKVIKSLKYADERMKEEFSKYLPKVISTFETQDNRFGMVIHKTPDLFMLKDILNYYDGKIPSRHVAWIMSSLHNLVCYLDYAKLSHNAITLDTYFISPKYHTGALLGGWWYSVPQESRMIGVPEEIYSIMPPHVIDKRRGSILTDLESIRLIGRELLGDRNGTRLAVMGDTPVPMAGWLRGTASDNAFKDYNKWNETLDKSFGQRRFIEMKINEDDLYLKINKK